MKFVKSLLICGMATTASMQAQADEELHFIMCGGEVREADQKVVDQFMADNEGVTINLEAVPWGTCQDKSLTLAAAGDPPPWPAPAGCAPSSPRRPPMPTTLRPPAPPACRSPGATRKRGNAIHQRSASSTSRAA